MVRAIRSSLASAARSRASRDRRAFLAGGIAITSILSSDCSGLAGAKAPGDFLERGLKLGLLDLDLAKTGFKRDPADAFGLARLRLPELVLQTGDFFPDLR